MAVAAAARVELVSSAEVQKMAEGASAAAMGNDFDSGGGAASGWKLTDAEEEGGGGGGGEANIEVLAPITV